MNVYLYGVFLWFLFRKKYANSLLVEEWSDQQFVILAEERADAGVGRLDRQVGECELGRVDARQQPDPWHMVSAGNKAYPLQLIIVGPGMQADDIFARGGSGIVENRAFLGGRERGGGICHDIWQGGALVAATNKDGAGETLAGLIQRGLDPARAAGEGGEAIETAW